MVCRQNFESLGYCHKCNFNAEKLIYSTTPCDDANVRLFVVKQNPNNATLQLLKKAVEQGRFGRIYMVNLNVFWTRPQEYYDSAA